MSESECPICEGMCCGSRSRSEGFERHFDRSAVESLLARSGADATDYELRQVVALLNEVDRLKGNR